MIALNNNMCRVEAEYDSIKKEITILSSEVEEEGNLLLSGTVFEWDRNHEPWESPTMGIISNNHESLTPPSLWRIIELEGQTKDYLVQQKLDIKSDDPLAMYAYTMVELETLEPPTLSFWRKNDRNKTRYVKKGKYWEADFASYGKDSGKSFADMFGGTESFISGLVAAAPPGVKVDTKHPLRLEKSQGIAMNRIFKQLKAEIEVEV